MGESNGVYTEQPLASNDPEVSSASSRGLREAIDARWQRQLATKVDWDVEPRTISTGVVDEEDMA
jgi:hypothetical protein